MSDAERLAEIRGRNERIIAAQGLYAGFVRDLLRMYDEQHDLLLFELEHERGLQSDYGAIIAEHCKIINDLSECRNRIEAQRDAERNRAEAAEAKIEEQKEDRKRLVHSGVLIELQRDKFRDEKEKAEDALSLAFNMLLDGLKAQNIAYCEDSPFYQLISVTLQLLKARGEERDRLRAEVKRLTDMMPRMCDTCGNYATGHYCIYHSCTRASSESCAEWELSHD